MMGRPTKYTPELIDIICDRLATSNRGLEDICGDLDLPGSTAVWSWLAKYPDFQEKYARAREFQAFMMNDEIDRIMYAPLVDANGEPLSASMAMAEVQRRKLIVDTLKWKMSKLIPKIYGDNRNMNVDVKITRPVSEEQYLQLRRDLVQKQIAPEVEDIDHEEV